jgi:hypothetical protein
MRRQERDATKDEAQDCDRHRLERRHWEMCCIWISADNQPDGQLGLSAFSPRTTEQANA